MTLWWFDSATLYRTVCGRISAIVGVERRRVGTWLNILSQETGCLRRFLITSGIHYTKFKRSNRKDPDEHISIVNVESTYTPVLD
jgi:hypothetical protein